MKKLKKKNNNIAQGRQAACNCWQLSYATTIAKSEAITAQQGHGDMSHTLVCTIFVFT